MHVHKRTATRYAHAGDPARGLEAFAPRAVRLTQEGARRADNKLAAVVAKSDETAAAHVQLVDAYAADLGGRVRAALALDAQGRPTARLDEPLRRELRAYLPVAAQVIDRLTRLRVSLAGGADQRIEVRRDPWDGWSVEELEHVARTGEAPEGRRLPPEGNA